MSLLTFWHTTANRNKTESLTSPIYFSFLPTLMHSNSVGSFQTLNEDYYSNSIVILKTPYTHHQIHNNNLILYINTLKKNIIFAMLFLHRFAWASSSFHKSENNPAKTASFPTQYKHGSQAEPLSSARLQNTYLLSTKLICSKLNMA